jgi:hypothetical protein
MEKLEASNRPLLDRKELERQTGFLNHLAMTFEDLSPFLKGCYLTLNSWRLGRNNEGWKVKDKGWDHAPPHQFKDDLICPEEFELGCEAGDCADAPKLVQACPRLMSDIRAILSILGPEVPPVIKLRSCKIVTVVYGFGDASGSGLGSTFTCGSGFTYRIGVWGADDSSQSSNWKEFCNIVTALKEEAESGAISARKSSCSPIILRWKLAV